MGYRALCASIVVAFCLVGCQKKEPPVDTAEIKGQAQSERKVEAEAPAEEAAGDRPAQLEAAAQPARRGERRRVKKKARPSGVKPPSEPPPPADRDEPTSEEYEDYGFNPWTETKKDAKSTFSVDVDTGSYTVARRKLMKQNTKPPKAAVRVEEFVNYFNYDYPNPDGAFGVHVEAAPSPFTTESNRHVLRVGVQGKRLAKKDRKPIHLTLLVDVSGSMNNANKLPLAVKALKVLTNNLQPEDTVGIVTYAGYVDTVLDHTGAQNRGAIFEALDSLGAGGGTGMSNGMKLAYDMAIKQKKPGEVSRVIVLSDGDANIGPSSHDEILKQIKAYVDEGVTLSTIGLGMGNYKDTMMEQLANKGNGNYYYIDSLDEARKVFGEQIEGTLQVIAKDVKLQVEFDPQKVPRYRLIGYENRDIADKDFRDDKVDAGEIGAGHTVTALYELELNGKPEGKLGVVRVRHKKPDAFKATEAAFHLTDADFHDKLGEASNDFKFAAAVATFAELLRESPYVKEVNFAWVQEVAKAATAPNQADRQEFLAMVEKAKSL